jgi:hypothetical protein
LEVNGAITRTSRHDKIELKAAAEKYSQRGNHMLKLALIPFSILMLIGLALTPVLTKNDIAQASEKEMQTTFFSPRMDVPPLIIKAKKCKTTNCPKSNCDFDCKEDQECRTSCDPNTGDGICDCRNR